MNLLHVCCTWNMSSCQLRGPDGQSAQRSLWYFHILFFTYLPLLLHFSLAHLVSLCVGCPYLTHFLLIIYDIFGQSSASLFRFIPCFLPIYLKVLVHPNHGKKNSSHMDSFSVTLLLMNKTLDSINCCFINCISFSNEFLIKWQLSV